MNNLFENKTVIVNGEEYTFAPVNVSVTNFNTIDQFTKVEYHFDITDDNENAHLVYRAFREKHTINCDCDHDCCGCANQWVGVSVPNEDNIITLTISS